MNKRISRLYAVQILYQMDYIRNDLELAVDTFLQYYRRAELPQANVNHLRKLVTGTGAEKEQIKKLLGGVTSRPLDRIEQLLRIILEVGSYEILHCPETPAKVIISEYVTISSGFFSSSEPDFVNGILEKIALQVRPDEKASLEKPMQAAEETSPEAEETTLAEPAAPAEQADAAKKPPTEKA